MWRCRRGFQSTFVSAARYGNRAYGLDASLAAPGTAQGTGSGSSVAMQSGQSALGEPPGYSGDHSDIVARSQEERRPH